MTDPLDAWIADFPQSIVHPFKLKLTVLYSVSDLYDTYNPGDAASWAASFDQKCYNWFYDTKTQQTRPLNIGQMIAARLHDAAIEHAIDDFLEAGKSKRLTEN